MKIFESTAPPQKRFKRLYFVWDDIRFWWVAHKNQCMTHDFTFHLCGSEGAREEGKYTNLAARLTLRRGHSLHASRIHSLHIFSVIVIWLPMAAIDSSPGTRNSLTPFGFLHAESLSISLLTRGKIKPRFFKCSRVIESPRSFFVDKGAFADLRETLLANGTVFNQPWNQT